MRIDYLGLLAAAAQVDRRLVYLAVGLAVTIPLLLSSSTRVTPSEESQGFHTAVTRLEEGDLVLLAADYNGGTAFELEPMLVTLVREIFSRNARILVVCLDAQGVGLVEEQIDALAREQGKSYGTDWVFLGYRPSAPAVIVSLASAPYAVFPSDHQGTPLSGLPLTASLTGFSDYRLVAVIASGVTAQDWVIYGHERYQAPMIIGLGGGIGPTFQSFLSTRMIDGLIAGLKGAAEYEHLASRPAEALRALSAQSVAHLLLVGLVILGNASYFAARWLAREPK